MMNSTPLRSGIWHTGRPRTLKKKVSKNANNDADCYVCASISDAIFFGVNVSVSEQRCSLRAQCVTFGPLLTRILPVEIMVLSSTFSSFFCKSAQMCVRQIFGLRPAADPPQKHREPSRGGQAT